MPWVGLTGALAFGWKLRTNWFAPTLTAFFASIVGALWIRAAGLSRQPSGGLVAAAWPVVGLFAMAGLAEAVAFGTLLCIDNAVVAEARMLRVEAAQIMDTVLPPQPLADDDAAAAIRDVVRMRRIADHVASEPILISSLVGQAIDSMALDVLADVLPRLAPAGRAVLDDAGFRDFVTTPLSQERGFLGEEAFGLGTIAQLALQPEGFMGLSDVGYFVLEPKRSAFEAPLAVFYRSFLLPADIAGYRSVLARYRNLVGGMAGVSTPFSETKTGADAIDDDVNSGGSGTFAKLITPPYRGVLRMQAKSRALHRAAEVLVAATRERLETGSLPESLEALVPSGLPAVPRDPFTTDQSLRSKRTVTEWLVYSVGPEGDDDGGPVSPGGEKSPDNDDIGLRIVIPEANSVNDR